MSGSNSYHFICWSCAVVGGAVIMFITLVLLVDAFLAIAAVHEPVSHRSTLTAIRLIGSHN